MNDRHEPTSPLDPEERALALRLARLGPHGEPSPALDARILATAHAATASRPRRARWPLRLGVAASVAIALGLAWQLRPLPGADPARPAPAAAPARAAATAAKAIAAPEPPAVRELALPPPSPAPPPPPPAQAAAAAAPIETAPVPEEPAVVFDVPSPVDVQAPAPAMQTQTDAPEIDVPPATVASPEVRDAWLARIRALAAAGHADEARASLQEFQRRYPEFELPDDLRPLLPPP